MDLAISQRSEGGGELAQRVSPAAVQLVYVESDPQANSAMPRIRSVPVAADADVTAVIAQRRPDLLLVDAAVIAAAGPCIPAVSSATRSSPARQPIGSSLGASGGPLKAVFDALRGHDRQLPLIVIVPGEAQDGEWVITAIEAGATDVISATLPAEQLRDKILLATERRRLQKRPAIRTVHSTVSPGRSAELAARTVIGTSDAMLSVLCRIARFAAEPVPVLVHGEPGTGKSLLALTLQRHAHPSSDRPLIIDCGQFASEMLDRLLFDDATGHVQLRESFRDQSLILENIDQACGRVQRRLLAAIRQREASFPQTSSCDALTYPQPLVMTCSTTIHPDCHATDVGEHRCGLIAELLFELSGYALELPPLRERGSDVSKLIDHFIRTLTGTAPLDEASGEHRITDEAKAALERYDWPGNVTQLRSVLASELRLGGGTIVLNERLLQLTGSRMATSPSTSAHSALSSSPLPRSHVGKPVTAGPVEVGPSQPELNSPHAWSLTVERFVASAATSSEPTALYGETIQEVEAGLITAVLEKTQGNLAQSARLLGITRVSLRRKIHSLGLQIPGRTESS
jgi:DNA-binding NtrC family response regulator